MTDDDTALEYFVDGGSRVDVVTHLLAGERAENYLLCHPPNLTWIDFFDPSVLEAIEPYLGTDFSPRGAVLYDPSGEIEVVVSLSGVRVEEVMW